MKPTVFSKLFGEEIFSNQAIHSHYKQLMFIIIDK